jgi:hypothetical protein
MISSLMHDAVLILGKRCIFVQAKIVKAYRLFFYQTTDHDANPLHFNNHPSTFRLDGFLP